MERLLKTFLIQTVVVVVLAIPTSLYLRSDYNDFSEKQRLAFSIGSTVGAVCEDGWKSFSTGRGTCSSHHGVKFWGEYLRHFASTTWASENAIFIFFLFAGLVGWYGYGANYVYKKTEKETAVPILSPSECCKESLASGHSFCFKCGVAVSEPELQPSPAPLLAMTAYLFMTSTMFAVIGLGVLGFIAAAASAQDNSDPSPVATATPVSTPVATTATPVNTPTPKPTPVSQVLIDANDVLSPAYTEDSDTHTYRFHLSKTAHIRGSFSASRNVVVEISPSGYSSKEAISSDTIDATLAAGTYELRVTSSRVANVNVHLTAFFEQ
ncbi:MAG: hypothetical protein ABI999_15080 [Acidobacteriota bacterium]